jgi:hypothetical protein
VIIPEYGRCPICDNAPVVIVRTRRGGMCVACAKAREDKAVIDKEKRRLRDALIRMTNALVDDDKRAGGSWQNDVTNG